MEKNKKMKWTNKPIFEEQMTHYCDQKGLYGYCLYKGVTADQLSELEKLFFIHPKKGNDYHTKIREWIGIDGEVYMVEKESMYERLLRLTSELQNKNEE